MREQEEQQRKDWTIHYSLHFTPLKKKEKDDELVFSRTTFTKGVRQSKIAKETVKIIQKS